MPTCPICGSTDAKQAKAKADKGSFECQNEDCRAKFDPAIVVPEPEPPLTP